jgi:hypothetical protein
MDSTPHRETGKQRAQRIPLDYYKHPDNLGSTKARLGWLALAVPLVMLGGSWFKNDGKTFYSRGPVSSVHATWNAKCDACHQPLSPLADNTFLSRTGDSDRASDQSCKKCHTGPDHHASQRAGEVQSCGSCHREHRGHDVSLIRVADADCLKCHTNLAQHLGVERQPLYQNVSGFQAAGEGTSDRSGGHPEFRLLREKTEDPGKLKFNHALHMSLGLAQPKTGDETGGGPIFRYSQLAEADRARYKAMLPEGMRVGDNDYVQLDCKSCHRLQSEDFGLAGNTLSGVPSAVLPARAGGAYMLPITYENQCRACHPLNVEVATPEGAQPVAVPHRVQPQQLHGQLLGIYAAAYLENNPDLLKKSVSRPRPFPGRDPDTGLDKLRHFLSSDEAGPAQQAIRGQVHEAEMLLYARVMKSEADLFRHKRFCGECHSYQSEGRELSPAQLNEQTDVYLQLAAGESGWPSPAPKFSVTPVGVKEVWFEHARFDHAAHRAVDCKLCHENAYPGGPKPSTQNTDLLLPGIETCLKCHSPSASEAGQSRGGARFDCAECHRYHGGDHAAGIGAAGRGVHTPLSVDEFLSGERAKSEAP